MNSVKWFFKSKSYTAFLIKLLIFPYEVFFDNIVLYRNLYPLSHCNVIGKSFVISNFINFPALVVDDFLETFYSSHFSLLVEGLHNVLEYLAGVLFYVEQLLENYSLFSVCLLELAFGHDCPLKVTFVSSPFLVL